MTAAESLRAPSRRLPRSQRARRARAIDIVERLDELYPDARTGLIAQSPFELLVAVMLSAQCTDAMVNRVTPLLFERYPDAEAVAAAAPGALEELLRPVNYYRTKSRHVRRAAQMLVERWEGQVPQTMEELLLLPGVGRKTANVVLEVAFGIVVGVVVDTHVGRLSRRLGFTKEESAPKIEADLMKLLPRRLWAEASMRLILHGRAICIARSPRCGLCALAEVCPSAALATKEKP